MKKKYTVPIICAIISPLIGFVAGFFTEKGCEIRQQNNNIKSQMVSIDGYNNTITINDATEPTSNYNNSISENESSKQQNTQYSNDSTEQKDTASSLETNLNDIHDFSFSSVDLSINGKKIPINSENSIVDINGTQYWSKEIVTNILPDTQTANIKDNTLYIGQVIENPHDLFDQFINDKAGFTCNKNATDSYGNFHSNCGLGVTYNGYVTFVLNQKYNKLKIGAAISNGHPNDSNFQIKADDVIVYSSDTITEKTKPYVVDDIPINNCSLLTIEYNSKNYGTLILYDAVLYN